MRLYRPVGGKEYKLIEQNGFKAFPPRLPHQHIFYPVLIEQYAIDIAKKWNTKDPDSDFVGYVLCFEINDDYISKQEIHQVGSKFHLEYWIDADKLEEFNRNIISDIKVLHKFKGN